MLELDVFKVFKLFFLNQGMIILWSFLLISLSFHLILRIFRTAWFKGLMGELLVRCLVFIGLNKNIYRSFNNVFLPTPDGTTQTDHIVVSKYGVFVIETKNMKGWIFGDESQSTWTQLIYKKKYTFQNPVHQNYKHIKALESLLDIDSKAIHSVVVFCGGATFKSDMPENVIYAGKLISHIKSKAQQVLSDSQVEDVISAIESGKLKDTSQTNSDHVDSLKSRRDPNSKQLCYKCGSPMVLRTQKRGDKKGRRFWGCSRYPKCRVIRNVI